MARPIRQLMSERDELTFYKGVHQLRMQIALAADLQAKMDDVQLETARIVRRIKPYLSWAEVGEMLGMTEIQAQRYLSPIMERLEDEPDPRSAGKLSNS